MWETSGVRSPRPGKNRKDKLAKPTCAEYLRHKREPIRLSGEIGRWGEGGGTWEDEGGRGGRRGCGVGGFSCFVWKKREVGEINDCVG